MHIIFCDTCCNFQDIVTESSSFDLVSFMPLLRERMYTKNTFARQFVISWISVLHAVPDINMVIFLPELLDGLFNILEDQTMDIKKMYVFKYVKTQYTTISMTCIKSKNIIYFLGVKMFLGNFCVT